MNTTPLTEADVPRDVPEPLGAYVAVRIVDKQGTVSGQFPLQAGRMRHPGVVGAGVDLDAAREAATVAALNVLGQIRRRLGSLDGVQLMHVDGLVAAVPGFGELPRVLDAASETFVAILGERGRHSRALVPVGSLPGNACLELVVSFVHAGP
ncbi:MAG: RidA family protein [Piscinibacter sp.]|nr:RidA family protein [Piscinibacter sp.]